MSEIDLNTLPPHLQALAARLGALLKDAKPGVSVTIPADLAQEMRDALREQAAPEIRAIRRREQHGLDASHDLPPHLRDDAPVLRCTACGRKSWTGVEAGLRCSMPQPSGSRCDGTMRPAGA